MICRKPIGWLVAQGYRLTGARRRAVVRCQAPNAILPVVCHALPPLELDHLLTWLKAHQVKLSLSFDDGWCETLASIPVLEKHSQPATIFIAPGEIARGNVWTDAATQAGISPTTWRSWYSLDATTRYAQLDAALAGHAVTRRLMTESELRSLADHPLISFGNHTWSHASCPHRPLAEMLQEIDRAQQTLTEWTGRPPTDFAYPFGRGAPQLDAALRERKLTPHYTRQGLVTASTLGASRNMAIEDVTFAENLGRLLMAWPRVGETL